MSNPIYNQIGKTYSQTRSADPRIVIRLLECLQLPSGSKILDIGAGTGSYALALAQAGYQITALEPSETMRDQGAQHSSIEWVAGNAESLPFENDYYDAVIFMLCIHHFEDLEMALAEAQRVTVNSKIVIFTYDPEAIKAPWLFQYFPAFKEQIKTHFPAISGIQALLSDLSKSTNHPFLLPHDLQDGFAGAAWREPERYLDEVFRSGTSAFQMLDEESLKHGLSKLESDLTSGKWSKQYGYVSELDEYDHGYTFISSSI